MCQWHMFSTEQSIDIIVEAFDPQHHIMIYKIYEIGVCAVNLRIGGAMHILEYENYEETKKHYDTDFSYNTYPCSIPLDFPCVPLHWHRETEIIYVKSGRGMVNVDGISYPVVKDSIVFILPGRLHSIAQYESEAFSYENIIFDMQMLIPKEGDTMSFNFFHRLQNFPEDFPVLIDRVPKAHRAVQICLDRIDDLRTTYPAGYYLGIKGWLYQLFFILESEILAPDKMREITTCDLPQQKTVLFPPGKTVILKKIRRKAVPDYRLYCKLLPTKNSVLSRLRQSAVSAAPIS